jgi:hypothetical protein
MRRTKKRSGRILGLFFLLISAFPALADEYALIYGTVFRPTGHAMAGAEVLLRPEGGKVQKTKSSPRGEFTFRVPAKALRYTVTVKAAGFKTESKPVSVQADERVDVTFLLENEK